MEASATDTTLMTVLPPEDPPDSCLRRERRRVGVSHEPAYTAVAIESPFVIRGRATTCWLSHHRGHDQLRYAAVGHDGWSEAPRANDRSDAISRRFRRSLKNLQCRPIWKSDCINNKGDNERQGIPPLL